MVGAERASFSPRHREDHACDPGRGRHHVARVVTLTIPPSLRLVQPVLVRAFRTESARTLRALKAYADTLAA